MSSLSTRFRELLRTPAAAPPKATTGDVPLFRRFEAHFDANPRTLTIVSQNFEQHDHPNVHLALEDLLNADGVQLEVFGVRSDGFRFREMTLSELVMPPGKQEGGLGIAPVEFKSVVLHADEVVVCIVRAIFLAELRGTRLCSLFRRSSIPESSSSRSRSWPPTVPRPSTS